MCSVWLNALFYESRTNQCTPKGAGNMVVKIIGILISILMMYSHRMKRLKAKILLYLESRYFLWSGVWILESIFTNCLTEVSCWIIQGWYASCNWEYVVNDGYTMIQCIPSPEIWNGVKPPYCRPVIALYHSDYFSVRYSIGYPIFCRDPPFPIMVTKSIIGCWFDHCVDLFYFIVWLFSNIKVRIYLYHRRGVISVITCSWLYLLPIRNLCWQELCWHFALWDRYIVDGVGFVIYLYSQCILKRIVILKTIWGWVQYDRNGDFINITFCFGVPNFIQLPGVYLRMYCLIRLTTKRISSRLDIVVAYLFWIPFDCDYCMIFLWYSLLGAFNLILN